VKPYVLLAALGAALVAIAGAVGGKAAAIGGGVAVIAQLCAVALLRPKMRAPSPEFMARWLGGMGIRLLSFGLLAVLVITQRAVITPLNAFLGFVGVLLPLLFLETRFLR
jgi:hypothetical protein